MSESVSAVLGPWSGFYVMTSSSAAALTGLMFVVITLVTGEERLRKRPDGISTFSTPTVVHFCAALYVSAILVAPWPALVEPSVLLALAGVFGVAYVVRLVYMARNLSQYQPDAEDWTWYHVAPFVAYFAVLAGAIALIRFPADALFVVAGGVLLLIFTGIRNAWDIVTFIATRGADDSPK